MECQMIHYHISGKKSDKNHHKVFLNKIILIENKIHNISFDLK